MAKETWRIELSYDADSDFYKHGNKMRISLIKILLKNGAYNLKAYVGSSIAFSCSLEATDIHSYWEDIFVEEFGDEFYYTLSVIHPSVDNHFEGAISSKPKPDFSENFDKDVETAKKELKEKK